MSAVPVTPQALQDPAESIQFPLLKNGANLTPGLRTLSTWSGACETAESKKCLFNLDKREGSTTVFSCKRTFFYILL
jgi:hypothetical protein